MTERTGSILTSLIKFSNYNSIFFSNDKTWLVINHLKFLPKMSINFERVQNRITKKSDSAVKTLQLMLVLKIVKLQFIKIIVSNNNSNYNRNLNFKIVIYLFK